MRRISITKSDGQKIEDGASLAAGTYYGELSPGDFDIFCLLATGVTTREAAENLCLSYKTVGNHSTAIKEKLGVKTLSELALLASRHGIVKNA